MVGFFPDYSGMPDHTEVADSALVLDDRQMKLLLHRTRKQIIDLLTERPATTSQLRRRSNPPRAPSAITASNSSTLD